MSDGNGALPEGWEEVPIGRLCDLINGRAFKPKEWTDNGLPIIRIQNLNNPDAKYNHFDGEYADKHLVRPGELLFAWSGTPGTSFGAHVWHGTEALLNQHIFRVLIPQEHLNKTYFRFAINHKLDELIGKAHGGVGLRHVTKGKFEATEVVLPPLAEQRRIVAKIEALQKRSSRARAALAEVGPLLEQFRQSVLAAAFSGRLTADWRARNPDVEPASELLNRIRTERRKRWEQSELAKYEAKGKKPPKGWKDKYKEPEPLSDYESEALPTLPDSWCWVSLMEIHSAIEPFCYGVVQPGPEVEHGTELVRVCDLEDGRILVDQMRKISQDINKGYSRSRLKGGEVLISVVGTIGRVAITDESVIGANIARAIARITPVPEIRPEWIAESITSPRANDWLNRGSREVARKTLNLNVLERLAVPLAPQSEMDELIELLRNSKGAVQQMEGISGDCGSALTDLDQSILAKAFCGELVPQDPNDEPASELLKRIRASREQPSTRQKRKTKKRTTA